MIRTLKQLKQHAERMAESGCDMRLILYRRPRRQRIRLLGRWGPVGDVVQRMERTCVAVFNAENVARYLKGID